MRRYGLGMVAALALGGCASQSVQLHRWPSETPAANNAADIAKVQSLAAAAALAAKETATEASDAAEGVTRPGELPLVTPADAPSMRTYDPWARLNRFTYRFNARFDESLFLPVANG